MYPRTKSRIIIQTARMPFVINSISVMPTAIQKRIKPINLFIGKPLFTGKVRNGFVKTDIVFLTNQYMQNIFSLYYK